MVLCISFYFGFFIPIRVHLTRNKARWGVGVYLCTLRGEVPGEDDRPGKGAAFGVSRYPVARSIRMKTARCELSDQLNVRLDSPRRGFGTWGTRGWAPSCGRGESGSLWQKMGWNFTRKDPFHTYFYKIPDLFYGIPYFFYKIPYFP